MGALPIFNSAQSETKPSPKIHENSNINIKKLQKKTKFNLENLWMSIASQYQITQIISLQLIVCLRLQGRKRKRETKVPNFPLLTPRSTLSFHKEKTNFQVVVVVGGVSGWF